MPSEIIYFTRNSQDDTKRYVPELYDFVQRMTFGDQSMFLTMLLEQVICKMYAKGVIDTEEITEMLRCATYNINLSIEVEDADD